MAKRNIQSDNLFAVFFDMMTGLLFIFIIALVAYMLAFNDKHSQEMKLQSSLKDMTFLKSDLIRKISKDLSHYGIKHKADTKIGVISLSDTELQFDSGLWRLTNKQKESYSIVLKVLNKHLPCYSFNPPRRCRKDLSGKVHAVIIEGHTDSIPLNQSSGVVHDNMDLSYQRAKAVYAHLTNSPLKDLVNSDNLPLVLAAGFGSARPLSNKSKEASKNEDRRIDIRLLMESSWKLAD